MPEARKIVSIGRVDNAMKKYVHQLPGITANLRRKGFDVTCDIYGHGDTGAVEELYAVIRQYGTQEGVTFHGGAEYSRFHEVLCDCFVFVGMGASAIEAAMFGIPTVTAVAFCERPISYGYLYELPLGAVGEDLEQDGARDIEAMIAELCKSTDSEYIEMCKRHIEYAKHYDQDTLCLEMLSYFEERLRSFYRDFKMPLWRVLEINVVRGFKYVMRRTFHMRSILKKGQTIPNRNDNFS